MKPLRLIDKDERTKHRGVARAPVLRSDDILARYQKAYDEMPTRYALVPNQTPLLRRFLRWVSKLFS